MREKAKALRAVLTEASARGELYLTGHNAPDADSVISCLLLRRLCESWGIPAQVRFPTPADPLSRRVLARLGYDCAAFTGDIPEGADTVLADHHAPEYPCRVAAVVDHHPTGEPPEAPFVWIEPAGACAVMVWRLMEAAGAGDEEAEKLAVSALYLDTIALRSAKVSREEAEWGRTRAGALGLDIPWLESEGMGLMDMTLPAGTLARLGLKRFGMYGKKVASSYVQCAGPEEKTLKAILSEIGNELAGSDLTVWVFLVHDPLAGVTTEYDLFPGKETRVNHFDHLASRSKEIMPRIEGEIREGLL